MNDTQEVSLKFSNTVSGDKKLKDYEKRLENIYSYLSAINAGQTKAIKQVKNATKDLGNETDKTNEKQQRLANSLKTALNVGNAYAFLRISTKLGKTFGDLINKSSSYIENLNLLEVAYADIDRKTGQFNRSIEESSKEIEDFISKMADVYGLDESKLTRQFGIFKQLANAMKLPTETASNLSELMVKMTNDIASLYNLDIDRASNALQSALAGQVRPIRTATGADITEKTLQNTVDALGLDRSIKELSYVEKRLIMVISLTEQLKNSQGDWGRTIESVANQVRIMHEQWNRLSRSVGNVFFPIIEKVMPYLNAMLMVLTEIFNLIASMMGFKITEFDYSGLAGASDATLDLIDGMDEASASVDTLKDKLSGLRGFDKLNLINTPKDDKSGSSLGIDPKIMDAFNGKFGTYNDMLDQVNMKARQIRDAILDWLGFTDGTYKNLKLIGAVLGTIMGLKILKGITGLITGSSKLGKILGTGGLYKTIKNLFTLIKKGQLGNVVAGKVANIIIKINNLLPLIGKLSGAFGVLSGSLGIKKQFDEMDTSIVNTGIHVLELATGGALLAGPLGAIAGGLTAVAIAGIEADKQLTALAKSELFGTMNVTTEQWLDMLKNSGVAITDLATKVETFKNTVGGMDETFKNNMELLDLYGIKYGTLAQQITDEDLNKIQTAVANTAKSATEIVDTTTNYLLTSLQDFFKDGSSLTAEEQANMLESIMNNGELQKTEIQDIQDKIIAIYSNAKAQNRALNEQEKKDVIEHLAKLREIETGQVSYTNAELEFLHSSFNDKSIKLDEESYKNWKTARDKFENEQEEIIKSNYNTRFNMFQQLLDNNLISEEEYNKNIEDLNNQRKNQKEELTKKLGEYDDQMYNDMKKTYIDLLGESDTFSVKQREVLGKLFHNIGIDTGDLVREFRRAGQTCSWEFNNELNKGLKNSKITIPDFNYSVNVGYSYSNPFQQYAGGGLPPVGQVFVANEDGPELIDQIGGQTFVANQKQIGEYMDKKYGANSQPVNVTIPVEVGGEHLATIVLNDLQNIAKTNGRPIVLNG